MPTLTAGSAWEQRAAWWAEGWRYRLPIDVTANAAVVDAIAAITVDWAAVFATLGIGGTLDPSSLRLVEYSAGGHVIPAYLTTLPNVSLGYNRFDRCPIAPYRGANGNLRALIPGPTAAGVTRRFFLYFETVAAGKPSLDYGYLDATATAARWALQRVGPETETLPSQTQAILLPIPGPLAVNLNSATSNTTFTFQLLTLAPSTEYTLSAYVQTSAVDVGTGVYLRYAQTLPTTIIYNTSKLTGTAGWTQLSVTFTTSADISAGRVDILWDLRSGESAWVDDVSLKGTIAGVELITNGGMETNSAGFPANWQVRSTGAWDNTVAHSGAASLALTGAAGVFSLTFPNAPAGAFAGLLVSAVAYSQNDSGPMVQTDMTSLDAGGTIAGVVALDSRNLYQTDAQEMVMTGTITLTPSAPLAVGAGAVLHLLSLVTANAATLAWTGTGTALALATPTALAAGTVVGVNAQTTAAIRVDALTIPAVLGAAMTVTRTSTTALDIDVTAGAGGTWPAGSALTLQFTMIASPQNRSAATITARLAGLAAGVITVTVGQSTPAAYSLSLLRQQIAYYQTVCWDWVETWLLTHGWGQSWNIAFAYDTATGLYTQAHDNDSSMGAGLMLYAASLKASMTGEARYYRIADALANYFLQVEAAAVATFGSTRSGMIPYGLNGGSSSISFNVPFPEGTALPGQVCNLSSFDQMATSALGLWAYRHLDRRMTAHQAAVDALLGRMALFLQTGDVNMIPNVALMNLRTMLGLGTGYQGSQSDLPADGFYYVHWLAGQTTDMNTGASANNFAIYSMQDKVQAHKTAAKLLHRLQSLASDTPTSGRGLYPVLPGVALSYDTAWGKGNWEFPTYAPIRSTTNGLTYTGGSPTSYEKFVGGNRDALSGRGMEATAFLAFGVGDHPGSYLPVAGVANSITYEDWVEGTLHTAIAVMMDDAGAIVEGPLGILGKSSGATYTKECTDLTAYYLLAAVMHDALFQATVGFPFPAGGYDYLQGVGEYGGVVTAAYLGDLSLSQKWIVPDALHPLICTGVLATPTLTFGATGAAAELAGNAIALTATLTAEVYATGTVQQLPLTIAPDASTVAVTPTSWGLGGGVVSMTIALGRTVALAVTAPPGDFVDVRRGTQHASGFASDAGVFSCTLAGDGLTADVVIGLTARMAMATAGQTHDAVLDGIGLLLVPNTLRRFDITNFSPQVRSGDPKYNDFSLTQHWAITSWHHGRGALEWGDPFTFYDSSGVDTRVRDQLTLAPLQNQTLKTGSVTINGAPLVFRLFTTSANLYCATGGASRDVWVWNNGTGLWDAEAAGLTADPTDLVEFLGKFYAAQGNGTLMRVKSAGVWADAAAGIEAVVLCVFQNQVLYRADNINEIYWTLDGTTWNGPLYVGDTNTPIRALAVGDGKLWIGKDDGLYYLQDQRVLQQYDFQWARDPNNFRSMLWWQGSLYFPILDGLYRLTGTMLQAVGPDLGAAGAAEGWDGHRTMHSLASGKVGRIVSLAAVDNWLYAAVDGGTAGYSQILSYNSSGWHQMAQGVQTKRVLSVFATGSLATTGQFLNPRIWYGHDVDLYNMIVPYGTEDPYEYALQTYSANGTLTTPWFDAGLANVWKEWQKVILYSEGVTINGSVEIEYELDDLGSFTHISGVDGNNVPFRSSPYQEIALPPNTIARKIRLRLTLSRGVTSLITPKVKAVIVQYMPRPNTKYAWQVTARVGRNMANPYTKQKEVRDPVELMQLLMRARSSRQRLAWNDGYVEPGITNLVVNPSFRVSAGSPGVLADSWTKIGGAGTALLTPYNKIFGLQGQQMATGAGIAEAGFSQAISGLVVGQRYTASAYVYLTSGDGVSIAIDGTIGPFRVTDAGSWQRLEYHFTYTGASSTLRVARALVDATQATTFTVCAVQVELCSAARSDLYLQRATSYCDGDQERCSWDSATVPYASSSSRPRDYQVFVTNIQSVEIQRVGWAERIRGVGSEFRVTFTVAQVD